MRKLHDDCSNKLEGRRSKRIAFLAIVIVKHALEVAFKVSRPERRRGSVQGDDLRRLGKARQTPRGPANKRDFRAPYNPAKKKNDQVGEVWVKDVVGAGSEHVLQRLCNGRDQWKDAKENVERP